MGSRRSLRYHHQMKLDGCNALITGASSGIGCEFARQLAGHAHSIILIARREEKLIELREELQRERPNLHVHIRKVDLSDLAQLQDFLAWLDREKLDVDLLVNNAGLGDSGPFAKSDPVRNKEMTLVNVTALTLLTRHLLPQMIAKHRGGILNVSSSAGFLPIPGSAVYAATKAYVTSFSEGLRAELRGTGVSVCAVCPGPVVTEFQQVAIRDDAEPDIGPKFLDRPGATGRARCARSTRSGPANRGAGVGYEAANAFGSNDANACDAPGSAAVTEDTRRRVTGKSLLGVAVRNPLKMKPVMLAHEHGAVDENLRNRRKEHHRSQQYKRQSRVDPTGQPNESIHIANGERNERAG